MWVGHVKMSLVDACAGSVWVANGVRGSFVGLGKGKKGDGMGKGFDWFGAVVQGWFVCFPSVGRTVATG